MMFMFSGEIIVTVVVVNYNLLYDDRCRCFVNKEYIFTIEWHFTLKTVVTGHLGKMRTGPGEFGPAGWERRAEPGSLNA